MVMNIGCGTQPKLSADDPAMTPAHLGNCLLRLAPLRCPLSSVVLGSVKASKRFCLEAGQKRERERERERDIEPDFLSFIEIGVEKGPESRSKDPIGISELPNWHIAVTHAAVMLRQAPEPKMASIASEPGHATQLCN